MSSKETEKPVMYNVWAKCPKCELKGLFGLRIDGLSKCPECGEEFCPE
ncbi:MAG: hypothetical protein PHC63_07025 [Candidatus Bathyarchaeota archaeon]|nr:hypothetical protein [Candidatus Bathyarchaeota archaeon]